MKRVKIRMLERSEGHDRSDSGVMLPLQSFEADHEYKVHEALASAFCDHMRVAERVTEKAKGAAPENKSLGVAPENKALEPKFKGKPVRYRRAKA